MKVSLLDYGAGNVRSVRNAILANGYEIEDIECASQIESAKVIVFPGVGSYGTAMQILEEKGYIEPLKRYLSDCSRPYLGICLGMQTLFESSEEMNNNSDSDDTTTDHVKGLGVVPGKVVKFDSSKMTVPHIGWNGRIAHQDSPVFKYVGEEDQVYFVHSYYAPVTEENRNWALTTTTYGGDSQQPFISSIQRGNVVATQFHPEKSGTTGLNILKGFLEAVRDDTLSSLTTPITTSNTDTTTRLVKRVVVALDVRSNDDGDLVVTKGDQYDVREKAPSLSSSSSSTEQQQQKQGRGGVRNLGKPVSLAGRYYTEGADEIAFLNITSFRQGVMADMPMLQVLEQASKNVFVPMTVGGGIRSYTEPATGKTYSAVEVAAQYFRAGADKVSLGSDAVYAAEEYMKDPNSSKNATSSITQISRVYGVQAVVISIDPKRVYLTSDQATDVRAQNKHTVVQLPDGQTGPNGETHCWYQCTVKGGREARDICAVTVARACEQLGAGEIMLNCIDMDGQCQGYAHDLLTAVKTAVTIPIIASSGAGTPEHFVDVFQQTTVEAALAAGMFHRKEVEIGEVKRCLVQNGIPARTSS